MENAIKVICIRHGQSLHNILKIVTSSISSQFFLTDLGKTQAYRAAQDLLNSESIDHIISSPTYRTRQTAQIIAQHAGISPYDINLDVRLQEPYFGVMEGKSYKEFMSLFKNPEDQFILGPPGGESGIDLYNRISSFLDDLGSTSSYWGKTVLLVTHGYPMCQIHKYFTGMTCPLPNHTETRSYFLEPAIAQVEWA